MTCHLCPRERVFGCAAGAKVAAWWCRSCDGPGARLEPAEAP